MFIGPFNEGNLQSIHCRNLSRNVCLISLKSEKKVSERFDLFRETLDLLEKYPKPLKRTIFLYENKDTQELKEFAVEDGNVVQDALKRFEILNGYVEREEAPDEEKSYSCAGCKYRKVCKEYGKTTND